MRQQRWALPVAAVIVAIIGLSLVAVAVHQDSASRVASGALAGSSSTPTSLPSTTSTTTPSPADTSTSTSSLPAAANGSGTTTTTTAGHSASTTTTRVANNSGPTTTAATSTGSGPAPARPGTYTYNQTGSSSVFGSTTPAPPRGTLVITASGGTEQWVRTVDPSTTASNSTTTVLFNESGVYTQSLSEPALNATCTFASPVPWPPWPLAVGARLPTSTAACSGQGNATLSISGYVAGTAAVPLDRGTVSTYVVVATINISVAGTSVTVTQTDWYAPSLRLPVATRLQSAGNPAFAIDESYLLTSAIPT